MSQTEAAPVVAAEAPARAEEASQAAVAEAAYGADVEAALESIFREADVQPTEPAPAHGEGPVVVAETILVEEPNVIEQVQSIEEPEAEASDCGADDFRTPPEPLSDAEGVAAEVVAEADEAN